MLQNLPAELILCVLSHLSASSLSVFRLVCKDFDELFKKNEESIYRGACIYHGLVPTTCTTWQAATALYSPIAMEGVEGWKGLLKRRLRIGQSWEAKAPSAWKEIRDAGDRVGRFKIDEKAGFVVLTISDGGLLVVDLHQPQRVLWSLPNTYVRAYSHVEYDNGYMCFDRGNRYEVWRHAPDFNDPDTFQGKPEDDQIEMSLRSAQLHASPDGSTRGHFRPWAIASFPRTSRASRLVYPTLFCASSSEAYFWDIPTATLVGTITYESDYRMRYVELSDRYAIICQEAWIKVFRRPDVPLVEGERFKHGELTFTLTNEEHGPWGLVSVQPSQEQRREDAVVREAKITHSIIDEDVWSNLLGFIFTAVHVLPDASTAVAVMENGICIMINNFASVLSGEVDLDDVTVYITVGSPRQRVQYLAYDYDNDRFAISKMDGVYILKNIWCKEDSLTENSILRNMPSIQQSSSGLYLDRIQASEVIFSSKDSLGRSDCLQLSDTRLWITWWPTFQLGQPPMQAKLGLFSVDLLGDQTTGEDAFKEEELPMYAVGSMMW